MTLIALSERGNELASLRVLGFTQREVVVLSPRRSPHYFGCRRAVDAAFAGKAAS